MNFMPENKKKMNEFILMGSITFWVVLEISESNWYAVPLFLFIFCWWICCTYFFIFYFCRILCCTLTRLFTITYYTCILLKCTSKKLDRMRHKHTYCTSKWRIFVCIYKIPKEGQFRLMVKRECGFLCVSCGCMTAWMIASLKDKYLYT